MMSNREESENSPAPDNPSNRFAPVQYQAIADDRRLVGLRVPDFRAAWLVAVAAGLALTLYSVGFIHKSSCAVEGQRYYALFDDALISMRYAWNWAHGNGPVWNPGERVEGYTNFGWLLIMTLLHLPGWSPSDTCLAVQILGIVILWLCLFSAVRLAREVYPHPVAAVFVIVLVACQYNLVYFSLMGMETAFLCLLVTLALTDACRALRRRVGGISTLFWFAPAVLVRMDTALPMLLTAIVVFASVHRGRKRIAASLALTASAPMIQTLWRHSYYGDWLPNTYYLKATGWLLLARLGSGLDQGFWIAITLGLPILLAFFMLLKLKRRHILLLTCFFGMVLYQTWIGGDAWPLNRFVVPYTIGLFVVAAYGLERILALLLSNRAGIRARLARVIIAFLVVVGMDIIHWDHALLLSPPQMTEDNYMNLRLWRGLELTLEPKASCAVIWAGLIPYFSERPCCDLLGKCDRYIAHLSCKPGQNRPGHNKSDFTYSVKKYRPDVLLQHYDPTSKEYRDNYHPVAVLIDDRPVGFFVRKGCALSERAYEIDIEQAHEIIQRNRHGTRSSTK